MTRALRALPHTELSQASDSFPAFTGPMMRQGCVVRVAGEVDVAAGVPVVATTLPDSLGTAWSRDDNLVADGPAQTVYGLWRGDVLCLVRVDWGRSAGENAPREAAPSYRASVGCEALPDRQVPRS